MNVVLVGFMGTGKTTVGKHLAERLRFAFVDVDRRVEKASGKTISEIFAKSGESAFRNLESEAVSALTANDRQVIATGGGVLLRAENRKKLRASGFLVCLSAAPGTILKRTQKNRKRPLLAGHGPPLERVKTLLDQRKALYARSNIRVNTDGKTVPAIVQEIMKQLPFSA